MKIVSDYHNTISSNPRFFWNFEELYVVTASSKSKESVIKMLLKSERVPYKELFCYPNEWSNNDEKILSKIWKINKICELKPDIVIDDSLNTLLAIKRRLPKTNLLLWLNEGYEIDGRKQ